MHQKLSKTFRFLRAIGLNYSEKEYGTVTLTNVITKFFSNIYRKFLLNMMDWSILEPIAPRMLRPFILRRIGVKVGKDVFIGDFVKIDLSHPDYIYIEDHVHIASGANLLCHQRDLTNYFRGDDYSKLGYKLGEIHLNKGCLIGMECFVLPGVTVGEGAIIGAGSLVSHNIPEWTIAIGRPAKVIKEIPIAKT